MLLVREMKRYRAYYCGLCKTIGKRCGPIARLTLNYDCTFLAAFLSALTDTQEQTSCQRCLICPHRGKQPMAAPSEALSYAADVNVLLAWYQLCDDWRDDRRMRALLLKPLLHGAFCREKKRIVALDGEIADCIQRLGEQERAKAASTDEPSDAFGTLLKAVIRHAPNVRETDRAACEWMFYNLGRWIYLADAWDDRQKDEKRAAYNPFLMAGTDQEAASFLLYISLSEAEKGYDLIDFAGDHGLIDNIVRLGCRYRTEQLLNKENAHESV